MHVNEIRRVESTFHPYDLLPWGWVTVTGRPCPDLLLIKVHLYESKDSHERQPLATDEADEEVEMCMTIGTRRLIAGQTHGIGTTQLRAEPFSRNDVRALHNVFNEVG